jgi:ubiquinol-cytochrome c reductase iron-sulfur subunit
VTSDDEGFRILHRRVPEDVRANDTTVVGASAITVVAVVVFVVAVVLDWEVELQMAALAVAALAFLVGFRRYFAAAYPQIEAAEPRPDLEVEVEPIREIMPMSRRRVLTRTLAAAAGAIGLASLVPIASLGPRYRPPVTGWGPGVRLRSDKGELLRPEDIPDAGVAMVWPDGVPREEHGTVILIRLTREPESPTRLEWVVDGGLVAYSKVCTHAGCPVGLYRPADNALYCPCHQAQFDAARGSIPIFGPASRPLPQLPLDVDDEGYLVATGDFEELVGPPRGRV